MEKALVADKLTDEQEVTVTDWLLADTPDTLDWDVDVQLVMGGQMVKVTWTIKGLDPAQIEAIEERNRKSTANETGMRPIDWQTANAEIVAEATLIPDVHSREFLQGGSQKFASPIDALRHRFKGQAGMLDALASEVRRVSGYDPERIGRASLRHVRAAKN